MKNEDFNMDGSQSDDFLSELLSRFEQMMNNSQPSFFDADELIELIDHYITLGQMKLARQALEIAISQYPNNQDVVVFQARYFHVSGRPVKAVELLKQVLNNDKDNVDALMFLGDVYYETGKQTEAILLYEQALSLVEKEEKPMVIQQIIRSMDEMGQHHKMIPYLKQLITLIPTNSDAMSELAYCYTILNREEEGIAYYMKLVDSDSFNHGAWFSLGLLYFNISLYEKAIEAFEFVLAIEPRFTSAALKIGASLSMLERIDSAIEVYKGILEYEKHDASIYSYLAYCYSQKNNFKKASSAFLKAINLNPEHTEAHLGLAYAYAGLNMFDGAYRQILKIMDEYDDVAELWFYKAYLEEQLDRYEDAVQSYRQGLRRDTTDVNAWLSLSGMLTEYFSDYEEALSVLDEAKEAVPDSAEVLYRGAAVSFEAGRENEGIVWLHSALNQDKSRVELLFLYNPLLHNNPTIIEIINSYL